jgi:hypothetical protein
MRGKDRKPVPEEHQAILELSFPRLECTVSMLENDWSPSVQAPLDALAARAAKEGLATSSAVTSASSNKRTN